MKFVTAGIWKFWLQMQAIAKKTFDCYVSIEWCLMLLLSSVEQCRLIDFYSLSRFLFASIHTFSSTNDTCIYVSYTLCLNVWCAIHSLPISTWLLMVLGEIHHIKRFQASSQTSSTVQQEVAVYWSPTISTSNIADVTTTTIHIHIIRALQLQIRRTK